MKVSIILVSALVILTAGVFGVWYWNVNKKSIIRDELEKAIREKSQGLYKIEYSNLELDEINGNLSVSSFNLRYDSIKYMQLRDENKAPFILLNISIPEIRVSGVKTPRALLQSEITGRHVLLSRPIIEILYTNTGKDSSHNVPNEEVYKQILGKLNFIRLDSVVISHAEIVTRNMQSGKTFVRFLNTTISLYDLAVDSTGNADTTRLLFAKEINLDCEKFSWQSDNKLYDYRVDSIAFRSATSDVQIKQLRIVPLAGEEEHARAFSFQTDRLDFSLRDITMKNTDFFLLADEIIKADTLLIGGASFKLYRDRSRPVKKTDKVSGYPQHAILKMPVKIDIKKAIIKNTSIQYRELNPVTGKTGKLLFAGITADVSNITNTSESIQKNNQMVCNIQSRFLNKVTLRTQWVFYLRHPNGKFTVDGSLGSADVRVFNEVAEPMGPARFKNGRLNGLQFNLTGTDYQVTGTVKMLYKGLKVSLLEQDDDSNELKKKRVASLFANIKIKNDNPDNDDPPREGHVAVKREVYKSMFNMAWKGLFDGVQQITGVK